MIPSVLATQIRQGVEDFLRTTFPISTPFFHGIIERLLAEENGLFKGPYLSIQLPFRHGESGTDFFGDIPLEFPPYLHQEQAFHRLSGVEPQSTIIATGTGSGKTECFLYPILDYCYKNRHDRGIKAIIIYPMNALATDQAGRLAKTIYRNDKLRSNVTAGLYIGKQEKQPLKVMTADGIITNKETLRLKPPDILLTNYKMLDYLLLRQDDFDLWKLNDPEKLRYLVVDELHTFDGAQGSDLACLIRRLKVRLKTPEHYLCCVGTSATLGSDEEQDRLRAYAESVFGEPFGNGAIINESRLDPDDFLHDTPIEYATVVPSTQVKALEPETYDSEEAFLKAQYSLWFGASDEAQLDDEAWQVKLGEQLKRHIFFQHLLKVLGNTVRGYEEIKHELKRITFELEASDPAYQNSLIDSLLALVSSARAWIPQKESNNQKTCPFLQIRIQYWLRELRRMVAEVKSEPRIRFSDDLIEDQLKRHLPLVHCRECGSMAWGGTKQLVDTQINHDLRTFYITYFSNDPKVVFLFPEKQDETPKNLRGDSSLFCSKCLNINRKDTQSCRFCGNRDLLSVFIPETKQERTRKVVGLHSCPFCGGKNSLIILGSRAASLTSIQISQLFASLYNDDKKLITFSDSVQDAAHRAGFFEARTWRFSLRAALQQFIMSSGQGMTLEALPEAFIKHQLQERGEPSFISTFIAPNMTWFEDYDYLKEHGTPPVGRRLVHDVSKRVTWEIYSEFGFSARIGRTLEKTSSSIAHLAPELLDSVADRLLEPLQNEFEETRNITLSDLKQFIAGLITYLKNKGAVVHPLLTRYMSEGKPYPISNKHIPYMPAFGPGTRLPVFITKKTKIQIFDRLLTAKGRRSWYETWPVKCFGFEDQFHENWSYHLYDLILDNLVKEDILEERIVGNGKVWGIKPSALIISDRVEQLRCSHCGHNVSIAEAERAYWTGAPCLRLGCEGTYQEQPERVDYYGKLYSSGDVQRIFAREHTGLLSRDDREDLEKEFKGAKEPKPWSTNLLSCTPTLEMGIDIGDLSSVILCSMPPAQANYLQRIGRAGRRDGNSLNLTIANARPHDLYFFAEPGEMISGYVDTPGVFLNASAVLERQFTAFGFDRWIESDLPAKAMPHKLRWVLNNLKAPDQHKFPYNLLAFIDSNLTTLLSQFIDMFSDELSDESRDYIAAFATGGQGTEGSLQWKILQGLGEIRNERESLRKKIQTINKRIREKERNPARDLNYEKDLEELKKEKNELHKLVEKINDKQTLNFFTDEGFLPNYAFPEGGVILKSVIYRKKTKQVEGESPYDTWVYEYERPASSAIEELAPDNSFFAGSRRVTVEQVDMTVSDVEQWRFCDSCSYMEREVTAMEHTCCPKCGSTMWSDTGRKRQMIKMRQVIANTNDRYSRIGDDKDDRDPSFYNKQMLVNFDESNITDSYYIDNEELPFGFEFIKKVTLRDINFGAAGEAGQNVLIAGVELPRKGFNICNKCGMIQDRKDRHNKDKKHALTCTARNQEADQTYTDCVYLYREFSSEAIRILLPVTSFAGSERKLHSFIATLKLGLKKHFKGNIDHLRTTFFEEPIPESNYRKKYIVLYDMVPGGTGYLKQLVCSSQDLMDMLQRALDALSVCSCGQTDKDGCYRCLFAYRHSYKMQDTSRETAMDLLSAILKHRENLTRIDSLRNVQVNALFDSELEARFIEALHRIRDNEEVPLLKKQVVNGKTGYFYKIGGKAWYIEPQVDLGPNQGVKIVSRADFVFWPARLKRDDGTSTGGDEAKPIAVFTDGYVYHRDRVAHDMLQRMAIARSGRFHVWSLSWKDVNHQLGHHGTSFYTNYLNPGAAPSGKNFNGILEGFGINKLRGLHMSDSFSWFIRFLKDPDEQAWRKYAFVFGLLHVDQTRFGTEDGKTDWQEKLKSKMPDFVVDAFRESNETQLLGLYEPEGLRLFMSVKPEDAQKNNLAGMLIGCFLLDGDNPLEQKQFEPVWIGYLRLFNLYQFIPQAYFVTQKGKDRGHYTHVDLAPDEIYTETPVVESAGAEQWAEAKEMTDPEIHSLLDQLAEGGWNVPVAGYELFKEGSGVIAEAELAWESMKIAVLRDDQQHYGPIFEQKDWSIFMLSDLLKDFQPLLSVRTSLEVSSE